MITICISLTTIILIILSILFFPKVKIKGFSFDLFWIISLFGALALLVFQQINIEDIHNLFLVDYTSNPLKTLILFFSMTVLSVFLDEIGLFRYLALKSINHAKSQNQFFLSLFVLISLTTIFTSNDIIILTFTPFICYFARNAKINPIPYIILEFVCANTMSMMMLFGNPTNIFLSAAYNIDFISYLRIMFFPTILASLTSLGVMMLIFRKPLSVPISVLPVNPDPLSKKFVAVGLTLFFLTILFMILSPVISIEMYIITLTFSFLLLLFILVNNLISKDKCSFGFLRKIPIKLLPFVISMFLIVFALEKENIPQTICKIFDSFNQVFIYGYTSLLASNLLNNIPMTLFYQGIISNNANLHAIYATIIGSNIGAFLTPLGALAGILLFNVLEKHEIKMHYRDFIKYGIAIALPTITVALVMLYIVLL